MDPVTEHDARWPSPVRSRSNKTSEANGRLPIGVARPRLRDLDDGSELSVHELFEDCTKLAIRYVIRQRNWYRGRAKTIRRIFRAAGASAIVLSAALPVVAFVDFSDSRFIITTISVCVAALTAFRTFFQWEGQWRVLKVADWELTALIAGWEVDLALLDPDQPASRREAMELTKRLLHEADRIVQAEAGAFFSGLHWPDTGAKPPAPGLRSPNAKRKKATTDGRWVK